MSNVELYNKLEMVLPKRDLEHINIYKTNKKLNLQLDLHGYTTNNAKRLFNNIINLCQNTNIKIIVIHGYNNGTAIKECLYRCGSNKNLKIVPNLHNKGVTFFYKTWQ